MKFSTGLPRLDDMLQGGVSTGAILLIYGQEKSGKTSLALRICASAARAASALYVDCSGRLHPLRLSQILEANRVDEDKVYLLTLENFLQQEEVILKIYDEGAPAPLVVFDDFTYLHRIELLGNIRLNMNIYRRLAFQLATLKEAALKRDLAVVIIGQIHSIPETGEPRAVAQRILTYWSDYVLRVERKHAQQVSGIFSEKPRREEPIFFKVVRSGVAPR